MGLDRRHPRTDVYGRVVHFDVAGILPAASRTLAGSHQPLQGNDQRRAQLRLRSMRRQDHSRTDGRLWT